MATGAHDEVAGVLDLLDHANERMLDGDCGPWKALLTPRDDVSVLGAFGGHACGREEVAARFDRTAAGYRGTGVTSRENVSAWVGSDLACVVDIECHEARLEGHTEPVAFRYRTTHLLRREDGAWRVVLRHADPLASFRGPDFAHVAAQSTGAERGADAPCADGSLR